MNAVMPRCFFSGDVTAKITATPPTEPWVMKVFCPLMLQLPSASRVARVLAPAASDPEPGSVNPHAPSFVPDARSGSGTPRRTRIQ